MISILKDPSAAVIDSMYVNASGNQVLLQPERIHLLTDSNRLCPVGPLEIPRSQQFIYLQQCDPVGVRTPKLGPSIMVTIWQLVADLLAG